MNILYCLLPLYCCLRISTAKTDCINLKVSDTRSQFRDGIYEQVQRPLCTIYSSFKHGPSDSYLYHKDGYWLISHALCQGMGKSSIKAESDESSPLLVDPGLWQERINGTWMESNLRIDCYTEPEEARSRPSTATIVGVAVSAFVIFFILFPVTSAIVSKLKRMENKTSEDEDSSSTGETSPPQTPDSIGLPPSYLTSFADASLEELRSSPLCAKTLITLPTYDEVVEDKDQTFMPPAYSRKPHFLRLDSNQSLTLSNAAFVPDLASRQSSVDSSPAINIFHISGS